MELNNPWCSKRSDLGLWMTCEGQFIQKEGVMNVTIGSIVCVPHEEFCQYQRSHSNMKRWLFTRGFVNIKFKVWTIMLLLYIYHSFLKLNGSKSIIHEFITRKIMKITRYCYCIDVILKNLATTFLLRTIKHWSLERLVLRWSNETTICSRKYRVNNINVKQWLHNTQMVCPR